MQVGTLVVFFGFLVIIIISLIYAGRALSQGELKRRNADLTDTQNIAKHSEIEKEIDGTTVLLLYILSFLIPLAGFIVGAIYASKDKEHYKHVGKNCLIFSVLNIVLGFIMVAAILGSM